MPSVQYTVKNIIAEFLGTMFLIIAAIGSIVLSSQVWGAGIPLSVFINAVAVGFILFALIETFGPISGAHFNPAVTLALWLSGETGRKKAIVYIISQLLGAIVGILMVNIIFYDTTQTLFFISDNDKLTPFTFISETICTFLLVAVIFGCVRGGSNKTSLAVGLVVGGMIITTSSTMYANPAVNLARIFTDSIAGVTPITALVWAIAQIVGALVASYVMVYLYPVKLSPKTSAIRERPPAPCTAFDCNSNIPIVNRTGCAPFDCETEKKS
ncbi:MAG: hypothetical protein PWQ88_1093 [Candidatus Methanomethylophilaceae archaeon]|nr:hypothetical protein [Candidatus Methanomethylophilaceae archaeon]